MRTCCTVVNQLNILTSSSSKVNSADLCQVIFEMLLFFFFYFRDFVFLPRSGLTIIGLLYFAYNIGSDQVGSLCINM